MRLLESGPGAAPGGWSLRQVGRPSGAAAPSLREAAADQALEEALGSLDRIRGIAKVDVFVASAPGFTDQSKVANGASDLLVDVFGDEGRHARAAVGVPELPLGAAVEIALVAVVEGG